MISRLFQVLYFQGSLCFIRQGVAGGWKKYFDDDLEKAFDDWIEKKTEGFKINFKWQ